MTIQDFADKFQCNFCFGTFVDEDRYLKHKCTQMLRHEEFKTPRGQAAWSYYQKWFKYQQKKVPTASAFLKSKYYLAFTRFTGFVQKVHIVDTDLFIKMMIDKQYPPTMWVNDEVYAMYLEYIDRTVPPTRLAEITVETVFSLADTFNCDPAEVFLYLTSGEVLQLIREQKLTPWVLLRSHKFKDFLVSLDDHDRKHFESLIRPPYWQYKFNQQPEVVDWMDICVTELKI